MRRRGQAQAREKAGLERQKDGVALLCLCVRAHRSRHRCSGSGRRLVGTWADRHRWSGAADRGCPPRSIRPWRDLHAWHDVAGAEWLWTEPQHRWLEHRGRRSAESAIGPACGNFHRSFPAVLRQGRAETARGFRRRTPPRSFEEWKLGGCCRAWGETVLRALARIRRADRAGGHGAVAGRAAGQRRNRGGYRCRPAAAAGSRHAASRQSHPAAARHDHRSRQRDRRSRPPRDQARSPRDRGSDHR